MAQDLTENVERAKKALESLDLPAPPPDWYGALVRGEMPIDWKARAEAAERGRENEKARRQRDAEEYGQKIAQLTSARDEARAEVAQWRETSREEVAGLVKLREECGALLGETMFAFVRRLKQEADRGIAESSRLRSALEWIKARARDACHAMMFDWDTMPEEMRKNARAIAGRTFIELEDKARAALEGGSDGR